MIGPTPNFADEIDCGSFFDHIDDLLDFPVEDNVDAVLPSSDSFPSIWQTQPDSFAVSDSVFSGNHSAASDLSAELSVPYEDIVHLEWLSTFCEDTFSGGSLTMKTENSTMVEKKETLSVNKFQTSSPVSVLESSSSCSGEKTLPLSPTTTTATGKRGRPRSKRPRPATFSPRPPVQLMVSPSSSITTETNLSVPAKTPSDSESFAESRLVIKIPKLIEPKKKIKKMRFSLPRNPADDVGNQTGVRKCTHCEITKTPQWRAGPNGPKTLCNACGVRFKSGRLFPEYRPAASPTFVPALHSNSHRKVVEMRNKAVIVKNVTMMSDLPDLIPNNSGIVGLDYM